MQTNMKLRVQKECPISGALGVVLRVSNYFGLAPLKFKRVRGGWCIRASSTASLRGKMTYCSIWFVILVLLVLDFCLENHQSLHFKTNLDTVTTVVDITFMTLPSLAATYFGTLRMQCVVTSLAELQKVNAKLRQYGPLNSFKTPIVFLSVFSFIGACFLLSTLYGIILYNMVQNKSDFLWHIFDASIYLWMILNKLLILQVTLILAAVPASFSHLNDCLTNLLRNNKAPYKPAETVAAVKHLNICYNSLCDVVKYINASHGVVLAAFVPCFLTCLVITSYNLISNMLAVQFHALVLQVIFLLIHLINMVMVIEPCHRTYEQMNRTKRLISQLLLFTLPKHQEIIHELNLFYEHLMNEVMYTPMDIFYLNRTVVVAIVGSITTYLVIMVEP